MITKADIHQQTEKYHNTKQSGKLKQSLIALHDTHTEINSAYSYSYGGPHGATTLRATAYPMYNKNSSGDEIANVNFYAVRPEATQIR